MAKIKGLLTALVLLTLLLSFGGAFAATIQFFPADHPITGDNACDTILGNGSAGIYDQLADGDTCTVIFKDPDKYTCHYVLVSDSACGSTSAETPCPLEIAPTTPGDCTNCCWELIDTNYAAPLETGAAYEIVAMNAGATAAEYTGSINLSALALPFGTAVVVNQDGEIGLDTTQQQVVLYGDDDVVHVFDERQSKDITVETPVDADNFLWFRAPYDMTVVSTYCIVEDATDADIIIQVCDTAGDNCTGIDAAIACDVDGASDTSPANPAITAGAWVRLDIGTIEGTPGQVAVTLNYTATRK